MTDNYEPNDSQRAAQSIVTGSYQNAWVCDTDEDYFSFTANAGDILNFDLDHLSNEGEIAARLYDGSSVRPLATSTQDTTGAVLTHTAQSQTTYFLNVYLASDIGTVVGNSYSLDASIGMTPGSCSLDRYEPNDTRTAASAISVGVHSNLYSCNLDEDHYLVRLSAGDIVTISADFNHAEGDIDLRLYEPGNFTSVADSVTFTAPETIRNYVVGTTGDYRIKITQYLDAGTIPGNNYTLSILIR